MIDSRNKVQGLIKFKYRHCNWFLMNISLGPMLLLNIWFGQNITKSINSTFLKFPGRLCLEILKQFFVTISVTELEKSEQIKVFKLTDVTVDLQGSRKYIFL